MDSVCKKPFMSKGVFGATKHSHFQDEGVISTSNYRSEVGQLPGGSSWKAQGKTSVVVHLLFLKHRDLSEPCYSLCWPCMRVSSEPWHWCAVSCSACQAARLSNSCTYSTYCSRVKCLATTMFWIWICPKQKTWLCRSLFYLAPFLQL